MGEPELMCCPFCGGKAYMTFIKLHNYRKIQYYDVCVECSQCGARSKVFREEGDYLPDYGHKAPLYALEAWNKRTAARISRPCR